MASAQDVAKFITQNLGEITAVKLQKLVYYSQAWNMVWDEQVLFEEDFQAWANGPVVPSLYGWHRGMFTVTADNFPRADVQNLTDRQRANIGRVLSFYGEKTGQWLSDLTHQERPWVEARGGLPLGASSTTTIPKSAIHEYYSSL